MKEEEMCGNIKIEHNCEQNGLQQVSENIMECTAQRIKGQTH
jgi:hypothetical protein